MRGSRLIRHFSQRLRAAFIAPFLIATSTGVGLAVADVHAAAATAKGVQFLVGAAVGDYSPPCGPDTTTAAARAALNCSTPPGFVDPTTTGGCAAPVGFDGPRPWAFMEPYKDLNGVGHWQVGDPWLDCDPTNGLGRWEGNFLGGGSNAPRLYQRIADPVTARAVVVSNGSRTIAVEVEDHEGLFDTYQQQIRAKVAADLAAAGAKPLDGIFISSTHDESAPDTIGLYAGNDFPSSVNHYFGDYLVQRSAEAIEQAYRGMRPARVRYAEAIEPADLRKCFSSYPFVDDQLMPTMEAVDASNPSQVIAILGDVSQHTETLGFNGGSSLDPGAPDGKTTLDQEKDWVTADWPYWFRSSLEAAHPGAVAIEMAGSVGSNETPEVWSSALSRTPQRFIDEGHPAGCRTLYDKQGTQTALGYYSETKVLGEQLGGAVDSALATSGTESKSNTVYGARADSCVRVTNLLFGAIGATGEFGNRPSYDPTCTVPIGPAPNGTAAGTSVKTQVAFFRIGDGEFVSVPGEVFPFTYLRSFEGPGDMPCPDPNPGPEPPSDPTTPTNPCYMPGQGQFPLPAWLIPHMHTPYRFIDGLGEDMIGYIFPQGNGVGVPGEYPTDPIGNGSDRFGCGHSDDSEAASSQSGQILGDSLVSLLDAYGGGPESISQGRYMLPDGSLSRDPLGGPEIKCSVDQVFNATGPAVAVWLPGSGVVVPAHWMSLSGRPQTVPDRNTRGYLDKHGARHWLDVYPDIAGAPASVVLPAAKTVGAPAAAKPAQFASEPSRVYASAAPPARLTSARTRVPQVLSVIGVLLVLSLLGILGRRRRRPRAT